MDIHIYIHKRSSKQFRQIIQKLDEIIETQETIMPTLQERFDAVSAQLTEASTEIIAEITALRLLPLPPEAEASLASIEAKAVALAAISPPIEPPPTP